ncbi:hypothetical protein FG379_001441 [Cryptosporidium bovis]|uniref:uncharacterized protein n=1 Tax=Cryptosporidium bovis TaxID=310047 RepID=UPI00351AA2FA|nr:hypothetical protein FG379_001441 [Cryptosporidium bovis]
MLISDVCSRLRRPGLLLPELCSLMNLLGDSLVKGINENEIDEFSVNLGWNQLVEILLQTINPTVRHMAFENVQYFLTSNNYFVFELKEVSEDICNGVMKLLCHWNTDVQLEALDIIFEEYKYNNEKLNGKVGKDNTLLSILLNRNIELAVRLLTLITHYNNCDQRFILRRLISSLKIGVIGVNKKEVVSEIIERLCLLGKNISLHEEKNAEEFSEYIYEFSKPYFLLLIFQVFDNIPDKFEDVKITCYKMIKDEISILLCKESLSIVNFNFYFKLIENGIHIMKNIYSNHNILFYDFIEWVRTTYNLLSNDLKVETINHSKLNTILRLINPLIISIFELQYKKCQPLFIWEDELKLSFKIDNNEISSKNMFIFNIDQIIESLIEFLTHYTSNDNESKYLSLNYSSILEYISNTLVIINIGLISDDSGLTLLKSKKNLILNLAYRLNNYINEIQSATNFESEMNSRYQFESYFIINYILSKVYFIFHNITNNFTIKDENNSFFQFIDKYGKSQEIDEVGFLEKDLFPSIFRFFNWILIRFNDSSSYNISVYFSMNNCRLRVLYYEIVSRYNKNLIPNNNNVVLVILSKLYKFSNVNKKIDNLFDINRINDGSLDNINNKLFSNTFFTHIILSNRYIWVDNKYKTQHTFLNNISKLKISYRYKYGGIFCIIGHFKLAKAIFESIKLNNVESSVWIDTLVKLSSLYDSFDEMNSFVYQDNNKKKFEYKMLIYKSKSLIEVLNSNIVLIKTFMINMTGTFFIGLYLSILTKIFGFMIFHLRYIRKQSNNIDKEVHVKIEQLFKEKCKFDDKDNSKIIFEERKQVVIKISEILKSLFGLINIAKFICKKSTKVLINLYYTLKIILINNLITLIDSKNSKLNSSNLNMLKSYFLFILEKTKKILYPDDIKMLVKVEKAELKQKKCELDGKTSYKDINENKFNVLIEKSFLDNINFEDEFIETGDDWEIVEKRVKTEMDDVNLYLREIGSKDILLDITKNYQDRLVYITYTYFKRSNWSYNEDYIRVEKVNYHSILNTNIKIRNETSSPSNNVIPECMEIIKYIESFPPLLLTIRSLAEIELNYELKGNVRKEANNGEINAIPTLRLEGSLKSGFPLNFKKHWKWVRIKVHYILDNGDDMVSNCYLDISVENGSFNWTQPIESVSNVKQLRITSIPMTRSKLSLGTPTVNVIPIF